MRSDFAVFILTHGRPDRVHTYQSLKKAGYTGKIYIVIDDEDESGPEYVKRYGPEVLVFSKRDVMRSSDAGNNFDDPRSSMYARNAIMDLAVDVGCKYFMQLDDDYTQFAFRYNSRLEYTAKLISTTFDRTIDEMLCFMDATQALSIAMSQGGDHIGGAPRDGQIKAKRKAMNSFICSVDRRFRFFGQLNEDTNTYTTLGRSGELFFTVMQLRLNQEETQSNAGGMTEIYLDSGTYVKTFYSVMYSPSSVKVSAMGDPRLERYRLHHHVDWSRTAPCILRETHRKATHTGANTDAP
jgi:hypothetical protein